MTKAQLWQKHLEDWKNSELPQSVFCKKHNLKPHTFQYWRRRLAKSVTPKAKAFIPVAIAQVTSARLMLGTQVAVEVPCESLPDLLVALRDRGLLHASA